MFFGQPITVAVFWVLLIAFIFAVILLVRWYIRRSSRSSNGEGTSSNRSTVSSKKTREELISELIALKIRGEDRQTGEALTGENQAQPDSPYIDRWESGNIQTSLETIKNYHVRRTNPYTDKDHDMKTMISKDQLKPHLDKVIEYITGQLDFFRNNYGQENVQDDFILETVLKFGSSSIELIANYKAMIYALKLVYPENPEKRTEVNRLFLGAADILNSKELQELVHKNRVNTS